jgi:hypothetical protein
MHRVLPIVVCGLLLGHEARAAPPPTSEPARTAQPEPPRGRGLYGAGIFGVTFGLINLGYGVPLSVLAPEPFIGLIPSAFGASFIALGAVGIHAGKRRRKVWQAWHDDPFAPLLVLPRRQAAPHVPWLIVGGTLTPIGLATIGSMIPLYLDPVLNTPNFAIGVTAWGAVTTLTGVTLLSIGAAKARRRTEARIAWLPTSWVTREGLGVALAGRF